MTNSRKRVIACSDMHCGADYGLTPPTWTSRLPKQQEEMWAHVKRMRDYKPDVILFLGDAIDGKSRRLGGRDLITADRAEQSQMAASCLKFIGSKNQNCKIYMVRGTPYHVGDDEDWEDVVAKEVGAAHIGNHEWVDVEGVKFNIKHKVGSSSVPHGRRTALERERLWSELWSAHQDHPQSDVILRGHVHYWGASMGPGYLAMTLPALCGLGSDYGTRQCSGEVHFGWVEFECGGGEYTWSRDKHVYILKTSKPKVRKA